MTKADRQRRALEAVAYHEAGHAVVALELRRGFRYATIVPETTSLGHLKPTKTPASFRPDINTDRRTSARIEREVLIGLAGLVAEGIHRGRRNHGGASSDCRQVSNLASYHYGYGEVLTKWIDYMLARTEALVGSPPNWVKVEALAKQLIIHRRLGVKRVREVCELAIKDTERIDELSRMAMDKMDKGEEEQEKDLREMGID
jgi:hypothetical protein